MVVDQRHGVAGWTVATAAGAPTVLLVTAVLARSVRTASYDPLSQTMSVLAARGAGDWIMTAGFVLSAACQIATATGLHVLALRARIALAAAGCCGLAVAALPVTVNATESAHLLAAGAGVIVLALWPVLGISSGSATPAACRPRWALAATLVLCVLVAWVYYEAHHGVVLGLAERTTAVAEMAWPLVVVISARRGFR